jgi:hypothetical protein
LNLLCAILGLVTLYVILQQIDTLPDILVQVLRILETSRSWMLVFMILLPVAMTMTLIWKIKEVIFASIVSHR